ncbi:MAG TPA: hypothetical protein VG367_05400 [Mucilaginibacter sp.]|nr:hypothetical protein [Mucilaginibacter sp.]
MRRKIYLVALVLVCFAKISKGQIAIYDKNTLEEIKNGYTHIVVKDLDFPHADEFLAVFKKYWTVTKGIDMIAASSLNTNLVAGDSYFSFDANGLIPHGYGGGDGVGIYIKLWWPTEAALKNEKTNHHTYEFAHIKLSADIHLLHSDSFDQKKFDFEFDGGGHVYHWNAGILKNYIQMLVAQLELGKKINTGDQITDNNQLALLKNQTLFCPVENFNRFFDLKGDFKAADAIKIFGDYRLKYQTISDQELGEKILHETAPFYYLLFIRDGDVKILSVINSETGESIYLRSHESSTMNTCNVKSADLKELFKAINKN